LRTEFHFCRALLALSCLLSAPLAQQARGQGAPGHFEGRQTHPIALTEDGAHLLAVNTPEGRLSVYGMLETSAANPLVLLAEIPVGSEPVSVRARTADEVWVVNEASDSVAVVSLSRRLVIATLSCADEPADVVFAGGKAFVSCARNSLLRVFDANSLAALESIPLRGNYPRALAASPDGGKVFAAFQMSGNGTTVLPARLAPPQPAPWNTNLPAPPATALIVPAGDPRVPYVVLDHDVAEISAGEGRVTRYFSGTGTSLFDLAVRPGADELWVANTEALNLVRFEPALRGHFIENRVTRVRLADGAVQPFDLNPGIDYGVLPNPGAQSRALAQPMGMVFSRDGREAWVAAFGSDRVARLNAEDGSVRARVDLRPPLAGGAVDARWMRGPRGMAWDEDRGRLYVLNKLANTISVIETRPVEKLAGEVPAGSVERMPAAVKEGRGFLFDARLSGNGTASCASCHIDADLDGLAWDLGDPGGEMITVQGANLAVHSTKPQPRPMHPMKGPMVTQTLRGLSPGQPLHWRGDRATLGHFNATFRDLLGGALIRDEEMAALQAYLDSLRHHPNPNLRLNGGLPETLAGGNPFQGQAKYLSHVNHCGVCHTLPTGSDQNVDDLRNIAGSQFLKTPPLQTTYQRAVLDTRAGQTNTAGFGLLHDGTGGLRSLPTAHFYELDLLAGQDFADVAAYVLSFGTGTSPAAAFSATVTAANRDSAALAAELEMAEGEARAGRSDLAAHGRIAGEHRGFFYEAAARLFRSDRENSPRWSRAELLARLGEGDALSFLGVLPGQGRRAGIDRNGNGLLDGDETPPGMTISQQESMTLRWPAPDRDWLLEEADTPAGPWRPNRSAAREGAGEFESAKITLSGEKGLFFRLRRVW